MKSLKDYSLNLPEQEYHKYPAWSHSLVSRYAREGFSCVANIHEPIKQTDSMRFGSLFDSMITRGKETLNIYTVSDMSVPPAEKAVLDNLLNKGITCKFSSISTDILISAMDECGFYPKFKTDTRLEKLNNVSEYFDVRRTGKEVVSREEWDDAVEMIRAFRNNKYTNTIFGTKNSNDIEYIYQAQFVVDLPCDDGTTVKFKIMPDLLVVNHKEKTVQPVDLKTSAMPAYDFKENFIKFRYDIEAASYTDVLRMVMDTDEDYKNYTILPYLFTDISRVDKVPVTFVYDPNSDTQTLGFTFKSGGKTYRYKHWTEYLAELVTYDNKKAVVPENISLDGANDIMALINC